MVIGNIAGKWGRQDPNDISLTPKPVFLHMCLLVILSLHVPNLKQGCRPISSPCSAYETTIEFLVLVWWSGMGLWTEIRGCIGVASPRITCVNPAYAHLFLGYSSLSAKWGSPQPPTNLSDRVREANETEGGNGSWNIIKPQTHLFKGKLFNTRACSFPNKEKFTERERKVNCSHHVLTVVIGLVICCFILNPFPPDFSKKRRLFLITVLHWINESPQ